MGATLELSNLTISMNGNNLCHNEYICLHGINAVFGPPTLLKRAISALFSYAEPISLPSIFFQATIMYQNRYYAPQSLNFFELRCLLNKNNLFFTQETVYTSLLTVNEGLAGKLIREFDLEQVKDEYICNLSILAMCKLELAVSIASGAKIVMASMMHFDVNYTRKYLDLISLHAAEDTIVIVEIDNIMEGFDNYVFISREGVSCIKPVNLSDYFYRDAYAEFDNGNPQNVEHNEDTSDYVSMEVMLEKKKNKYETEIPSTDEPSAINEGGTTRSTTLPNEAKKTNRRETIYGNWMNNNLIQDDVAYSFEDSASLVTELPNDSKYRGKCTNLDLPSLMRIDPSLYNCMKYKNKYVGFRERLKIRSFYAVDINMSLSLAIRKFRLKSQTRFYYKLCLVLLLYVYIALGWKHINLISRLLVNEFLNLNSLITDFMIYGVVYVFRNELSLTDKIGILSLESVTIKFFYACANVVVKYKELSNEFIAFDTIQYKTISSALYILMFLHNSSIVEEDRILMHLYCNVMFTPGTYFVYILIYAFCIIWIPLFILSNLLSMKFVYLLCINATFMSYLINIIYIEKLKYLTICLIALGNLLMPTDMKYSVFYRILRRLEIVTLAREYWYDDSIAYVWLNLCFLYLLVFVLFCCTIGSVSERCKPLFK